MEFDSTPRADAFTQRCRDVIRTLTYEDIFACTVYAPPMLFMLGPAAILGFNSPVSVVFQSVLGFVLSGLLHGLGHRLLADLPKSPQRIYLGRSYCLPVKLTLRQFLWMLELVVGMAVFSGQLGKRIFSAAAAGNAGAGLALFVLGLALFFAPVLLGRRWIERYYPAMPLLGPADDVINRSVPGLRSLLK